jgi:hypothetical protein
MIETKSPEHESAKALTPTQEQTTMELFDLVVPFITLGVAYLLLFTITH